MARVRLLATSTLIILSACDTPRDLTAPARSLVELASASGASIIGHANGDGTFNIGAPGADIAFNVTALLRADGTAKGSVHYVTDLTDFGLATIEIRFDVTCMSIDSELGRAWIGGVVTENNSTNPTFVNDPVRQVGRDVWFRLVDNNDSGTPDLTTQLGFEGSGGIITSAEYCQRKIWPADPAHPVNSGNLSVR